MMSDEEQIISRQEQMLEAFDEREMVKIMQFFTDDFIFNLTNYVPLIGKKEASEHYFGLGSREKGESVVEKRDLRFSRIRVSKMGDIANMCGIQDLFLDGVLVQTFMFLSGWVKKDAEWFIESVSIQEIELGWTW